MMQRRAVIIQVILLVYTLIVGFLSAKAWSDEFQGEPRAYRILIVIALSMVVALKPSLLKQDHLAEGVIQMGAVTLLTVMWCVVGWSV